MTALGVYEETPRFTVVWAPPTYRAAAEGPVRHVAVSRNDRVAGHAWVAPGEGATDFLPRADLEDGDFDVAVWWVERLREAHADQRSPEDAFDLWVRRAADYGMTTGEVAEAESLQALYGLVGGTPDGAMPAARDADPGAAAAQQPAATTNGNGAPAAGAAAPRAGDREEIERDIRRLDEAVAAKPVPEDLVVWRNASSTSFQLDWRHLTGTIQREPAFLAVALTRFEELDAAEVVLHLRVPAGVPAIYLNSLDRHASLPAPTLLLRRGLAVRIHDVRRRGGHWYVQGVILPPEQGDAIIGLAAGAATSDSGADAGAGDAPESGPDA